VRFLILISSLVGSTALAAPASTAASAKGDDDPSLRALTDELNRYRTVKMESLESPYFLAGYVNDAQSFEVRASFGALLHRGRDARRSASVQVRVGTPELDNTNFVDRQHQDYLESYYADRAAAPVPREADYDAIRQALWLRFDSAYKRAAEALARKRAYLETNAAPDRPNDFAPAPMANVLMPRVGLKVDEARWTKIVKEASAIFRDGPGFTSGSARFRETASNQCYVSSDPVQDRFGDTQVEFAMSATAQASDGMELEVHTEVRGRSEADLPKDAELLQMAKDLSKQLVALQQAPLLPEDYSGPVLFTGHAAARFFLEALGKPLSRPRDPLGMSREGRLTERLNKHVATPMLTVRDDPTLTSWHGKALLGWFPIDDDGVKPKPITLVDKGVLSTYYMSRTPTQRIAESNGHSRGGDGSVGNLFVEATKTQSREALKKQLIQLAKENDQDYALLVDELNDSEDRADLLGDPGMGSGGDIHLGSPAVAYRVFLDGHEELVRGASFKPISFRALRDVVGLGADPSVLNTVARGQWVSVIAPSVLVSQLELKKPSHEFEKPPVLARPAVSAK
jgi:predicted Zn-dependent protease